MRLAILMFLLWLVPCGDVCATAAARCPPSRSWWSSERASCTRVPDRAWITIGAESRAPSPREAQRRNTELMQPVQDKLRAAGIPADAIRTIGYDVQYEWDFVNGKRVGRGYVARNTIEVRIDTDRPRRRVSRDRGRVWRDIAGRHQVRHEGSGQAGTRGAAPGGRRRPRSRRRPPRPAPDAPSTGSCASTSREACRRRCRFATCARRPRSPRLMPRRRLRPARWRFAPGSRVTAVLK